MNAKKKKAQGALFHVRSVGGGWEVFDRHGHRVSERLRAQADAVAHAKELARREGAAQILVHGEDGGLMSEFFYQRAERPSLDYDATVPWIAATHVATRRR